MTIDSVGLKNCARYAFPPNSYNYCGPAKQINLKSYIRLDCEDRGLTEIISRFETLYPYLQLIAGANDIRDPFDRRVVEAYWIGNSLLDRVPKRTLFNHLKTEFSPKLSSAEQHTLEFYTQYGQPYHNFHVMGIFTRMGHLSLQHTIGTMDLCRISWGKVKHTAGGNLIVLRQPLVFNSRGGIRLGVIRAETVRSLFTDLEAGDVVSLHWGYACAKLTVREYRQLVKYTQAALNVFSRINYENISDR